MKPPSASPDPRLTLLDERGQDLYWFVESLTPGIAAATRRDLLERGLSLSDDEQGTARPLLLLVLRRIYLRAATLRGNDTQEASSDRTTTVLRRPGDAIHRPTKGDGEHLRRRLPLPCVAAICLHHLGLDEASIAYVVGLSIGDPRISRAFLAGVLRRGFAHLVQCPRIAISVLEILADGGGDPREILGIARARAPRQVRLTEAPADAYPLRDAVLDLLDEIAPESAPSEASLVMLIFNKDDLDEVRQLRDELRSPRLSPWIFDDDAPVGLEIYEVLDDLIERAGAFAVTIGPSGRGRWQKREIGAAINRAEPAPVVVVLLASLEPASRPDTGAFLRNFPIIDLRERPRSARLDELLRALGSTSRQEEPHDRGHRREGHRRDRPRARGRGEEQRGEA